MAGVALTSVMALLDPAPAWRFIVTLPAISGITLGPQYVMHIDLPLTHISPEDEHFANAFRYHPTALQVDDVTMSFYLDGDYQSLNYLEAWRQLVFNPATGDIGLPVDFKQSITVQGLDVEGNIGLTAYLYGCWPMARTPLTYDGSTAHSVLSLQATFKCEAILYNFNNLQSSASSIGSTINTG